MYGRYLALFGATLAAALLSVGAFTLLVDPFACNGWVNLPGFNASKTRLVTRLNKTMHVSCHDYDAMEFGTSRAGFLPWDHPTWAGYHVYNYAIPAASMNEVHLALGYAQRLHPLRRVVIGLDFFMFGWQPELPDSAAAFLSATRKERPNLVDYSLTLLSVSSAVETVWDNLDQARGGMLRKAASPSKEDGRDQVRLFRGQLPNYLGIYASIQFRPLMFNELRRTIELCRQQGIELTLYMSPTHAAMMEIIHERGRWSEFEDWKREVAQIAWNDGKDPVPLYDFSGYNAYTTEPVPTEANHYRRMQWYYDSSHFYYSLGSKVLDRLYGADQGEAPSVPGFGVRLRPDTVERDLVDNRTRREAWLATHPPEVAWVHEAALAPQ